MARRVIVALIRTAFNIHQKRSHFLRLTLCRRSEKSCQPATQDQEHAQRANPDGKRTFFATEADEGRRNPRSQQVGKGNGKGNHQIS